MNTFIPILFGAGLALSLAVIGSGFAVGIDYLVQHYRSAFNHAGSADRGRA